MSKNKGKKPSYRNLNPVERDTLFAFYEKHGGNINAMIRDHDCPFHSYAQTHYYAHLHHFKEQLDENRRKRAEEVTRQLKDSKISAIERAQEMLRPRQIILRNKFGGIIYDEEGEPKTVEIYPSHKELKAAWEIIKTEIGEPTSINKNENINDDDAIRKATDELKDIIESARKSA